MIIFTRWLLIFNLTVGVLSATADGPDYFKVQDVAYNDVLWIHTQPSSHSSKIFGIPPEASCIKNLGCRKKWCKVSYSGVTGWVYGKYLGEGDCANSSNVYNGSVSVLHIPKISWGACMIICEDVSFCKKAHYNKNNGVCKLQLDANHPSYMKLQQTCPKKYWHSTYRNDRWSIQCDY
jgi:uncharacterized protein YgiM (DUF1202 family)